MIGRSTQRFTLTPQRKKKELAALARQKRKTRSVAFREQIILNCSEDRSDSDIAVSIRTSNLTVGPWRKRYLESGPPGILDEPRGKGGGGGRLTGARV